MLNATICAMMVDLTVEILTAWCSVITTADPSIPAENISYEEKFLVQNCCPVMLNDTSLTTKGQAGDVEHFNTICNYLTKTNSYDGYFNDSECKEGPLKFAMNYPGKSGIEHLDVLTFTLYFMLIPIGCIGNILVISTVQKATRQHNVMPMIFIKNLAIADLLTIVFHVFIFVVYNYVEMSDAAHMYLFASFDIFVEAASITFVMAISIDRATAVLYPMKHFTSATKPKARFFTTILWAFCLAFFALSLIRIWLNNKRYSTWFFLTAATILFYVPCLLVVLSYTVIIIITIRSNRQLSRTNARRVSITTRRLTRHREVKLAINVTIITIPFVCGWGYCMCLGVYETLNDVILEGLWDWLFVTIPLTVSCINPVIYLMLTSSLRKSSLKVIHGCYLFERFKLGVVLRNSFSRGSSRASNETGLNEDDPLAVDENI